jgi:hypothetical protein
MTRRYSIFAVVRSREKNTSRTLRPVTAAKGVREDARAHKKADNEQKKGMANWKTEWFAKGLLSDARVRYILDVTSSRVLYPIYQRGVYVASKGAQTPEGLQAQ